MGRVGTSGSPDWKPVKGSRPVTGNLTQTGNLAQAGGAAKTGRGAVQGVTPTQSSNNTRAVRSARFEPVQVRFPAPGIGAAAIEGLRAKYVVNGKVSSGKNNVKLENLQDDIDRILANPDKRAALIARYGLNSAENQKALVAVGACESGGNGDTGETMTVTMNRALIKNMMTEMTDSTPNTPSPRTSIMDVVNEPNQYESRARVQTIMDGGDTKQKHMENFGPQAREVLRNVLQGQSTFSKDASGTYFFRQRNFEVGNDFTIGKHKFSDRLSANTSMVQDVLHNLEMVRWQ